MLESLKYYKSIQGIDVRCVHCDNAGENESLKLYKQEGMGIKFEHTAPSMPRQNGRLEQKFVILYKRFQAMLNGRNFSPFLKNRLWAEAENIAALLKISLPTMKRQLYAYFNNFGKEERSILTSLQKLVKFV